MDLERFEKDFQKKLKSYPKVWGKEERILHLVEEIGEFAEITLQYNGRKEPKRNLTDVKIALADVLEDVLALSVLYDLKFEKLLEEIINEKNN
ncbi:MAG: hypothetical protein HYU81_01155 [Candidatus Brennerbacteria bacterium]|nr:hypothetical protein [Candidatus Brennerbacteria bacterium]